MLTSNGRCLPTCAKTEYFDGPSGTCKSCDSSCNSCSTGGSSGCLSCASDKTVLRVGKCEAVDCGSGSGAIDGLGVCLAELVTVPSNAAIPPATIPPLDPNAANDAQPQSSGFTLQWWQILLIVLGGLFIIIICIVIWRRQARKKRAKRTQEFKAQLEKRGIWARLWCNPFSLFTRKKKDNRARDLEGARSSAGDWRTSAGRTEEHHKSWYTMQEPTPRRPSITGRTMTSDGYTYESRAERSEGRSQRTNPRPLYLAQARSQYGESQYAREIEEEDEYRSERSNSYRAPSSRAPSSRREREHRRQPSYVREQDRHYADLMNEQSPDRDSPSLYSQPRQRPKAPIPDLLTSRFSGSTEASALPKGLRKPAHHEPMPDFDMQSLAEVNRSEPKKYTDAEIIKLNAIFSDQPREHSTGGTTAVDRNPFRQDSY